MMHLAGVAEERDSGAKHPMHSVKEVYGSICMLIEGIEFIIIVQWSRQGKREKITMKVRLLLLMMMMTAMTAMMMIPRLLWASLEESSRAYSPFSCLWLCGDLYFHKRHCMVLSIFRASEENVPILFVRCVAGWGVNGRAHTSQPLERVTSIAGSSPTHPISPLVN